MIIKKKNFNLTPNFRGKWPFTVPEVTVIILNVRSRPDEPESEMLKAFAISPPDQWGMFALSGLLESYEFAKLEDSGIWSDEWIMGATAKKSLTPFFEYLEKKAGA